MIHTEIWCFLVMWLKLKNAARVFRIIFVSARAIRKSFLFLVFWRSFFFWFCFFLRVNSLQELVHIVRINKKQELERSYSHNTHTRNRIRLFVFIFLLLLLKKKFTSLYLKSVSSKQKSTSQLSIEFSIGCWVYVVFSSLVNVCLSICVCKYHTFLFLPFKINFLSFIFT